jgi:hypothetical protein
MAGFGLCESKLFLYPLLVEPHDPAVADFDHRHSRLACLADHVPRRLREREIPEYPKCAAILRPVVINLLVWCLNHRIRRLLSVGLRQIPFPMLSSPSKGGLRPLERFVPQAEAGDDAGGYRSTRWNSVYNSQHYPHVLVTSRNDFRTTPGSSRRQTTPNSTVGESPCTGL